MEVDVSIGNHLIKLGILGERTQNLDVRNRFENPFSLQKRKYFDGQGKPFYSWRTLKESAPVQIQKSSHPNAQPYDGKSLGDLHKKISTEWHPTWNRPYTPFDFNPRSHQCAYWRCKKGHVWIVSIANRSNLDTGCPCCAQRAATKEKNLLKENPELSKYWDYTKNGDLKPEDLLPTSNQKTWWKCLKQNHKPFRATICELNRDNRVEYCKSCDPRKASSGNNIATLRPDLAKEWHKSNKLRPENTPLGSNEVVNWQCPRFSHHIYKCQVTKRVLEDRGCNICNQKTSRNEHRAFCELAPIFPDLQQRQKILGKEADLFIPSLKICIEIDGVVFHKGTEKKEWKKTRLWTSHGYKVIRVREEGLGRLGSNNIFINLKEISKKDINKLLRLIQKRTKLNKTSKHHIAEYIKSPYFKNVEEFRNRVSFRILPKGLSLKDKAPQLIKFWDFKKNKPLKPDLINALSHYKCHWRCKKCGEEWVESVLNMFKTTRRKDKGEKCGRCAGFVFTKQNSLAVKYPALKRLWLRNKNGGLSPFEVSFASRKKYWFRCAKRGCQNTYKRGLDKMVRKEARHLCKTCSVAARIKTKRERHPGIGFKIWRSRRKNKRLGKNIK